MKDIQNILKKAREFSDGEKAILATVVDVVGSGYRRPGARMLIDENGYSIGTVSGGCLEADVLERAKKVLESGEPTVITYDTTKDENSVFGLSMGCRGIVRILLEPFAVTSGFYKTLIDTFDNRIAKSIGTIISATPGEKVGGRMFYNQKGEFKFENLPETFSDTSELKSDIEKFYKCGDTFEIRNYKFREIDYEVFFENVNPPLNLLIFGAGYDALPLMKFAREIGWRVTAIDHRPAFADVERLLDADEIIALNSEDLSERIFQDENSVAVIMTHNYDRDRNILRRLLLSNFKYIGALGPKKRTEKLLDEIGENFGSEQMKKLYAPVGLDIGADSPEAIALAIVAEIQSVLKNRNGGFLRERQGSIYDRK